jgi:hypothetical protein
MGRSLMAGDRANLRLGSKVRHGPVAGIEASPDASGKDAAAGGRNHRAEGAIIALDVCRDVLLPLAATRPAAWL